MVVPWLVLVLALVITITIICFLVISKGNLTSYLVIFAENTIIVLAY